MMIFILFILCGSLFLLWQSEEAPIILVDTAPLTTEAPGSEPSVIVTATPDVPPLATSTQVPIEAPDVSPTMVPTEIPTQIPVAAPTEAPTEIHVVVPAVTALTTYLKSPMTSNPYTSLSVPTQITKIGTDYFLVDCYHDLILTATSLDTPLNQWLVMSDQINRGHTIAGNGTVYLADDTENHRILVFIKEGNTFIQTQIFENIGNRPHYIDYDAATNRFYALSSLTGELYVFYQEADTTQVQLEKILNIPGMQNTYIRSFSIEEDEIYFACNNGIILRTRLEDLTLLEQFSVPAELGGLIQVVKIQDFYYLTVSTDLSGNSDSATILRTRELCNLADYGYEDLYETFGSDGTPYYISSMDGHYFLTQHCYLPGHGVWQFDIMEEDITNVVALYP
ncbi:MAG: hypothetical protein IJN16_10665 [Lachnospiraceae bacterium]|nr:hypothetical protein [Lachnospiraceae bacterium]